MNLYIIRRRHAPESHDGEYTQAVVVARDAEAAVRIHPNGAFRWAGDFGWVVGENGSQRPVAVVDWEPPGFISAIKIGVAENTLAEGTVVMAHQEGSE